MTIYMYYFLCVKKDKTPWWVEGGYGGMLSSGRICDLLKYEKGVPAQDQEKIGLGVRKQGNLQWRLIFSTASKTKGINWKKYCRGQ